jgi:hypothetical protein
MKNTRIVLTLLVFSIFLSCKKDDSSTSTSSTNLLADTVGMKVINMNVSLQNGNLFSVDLNGDLLSEFNIIFTKSTGPEFSGSTITISGPTNSDMLFRSKPANPSFAHFISDETSKQYNPTSETHFTRRVAVTYTCSRLSANDIEYTHSQEYAVSLAGAGEQLTDKYMFKSIGELSSILWQGTITANGSNVIGDTLLVYNYSLSDCNNQFVFGQDKYVLFKLTIGSTPRLGWLRIRFTDANTLQIMEAAVQE